jgi:hypothetical protein
VGEHRAALGAYAEYLVTGKTPTGISEESFRIALVAERLDETGKAEAPARVGSPRRIGPTEKGLLFMENQVYWIRIQMRETDRDEIDSPLYLFKKGQAHGM